MIMADTRWIHINTHMQAALHFESKHYIGENNIGYISPWLQNSGNGRIP